MTQTALFYIEQTEAWIKTQRHAINSCDFNIKQAEEKIEFLKKEIELETAERASKFHYLTFISQELHDFKRRTGN